MAFGALLGFNQCKITSIRHLVVQSPLSIRANYPLDSPTTDRTIQLALWRTVGQVIHEMVCGGARAPALLQAGSQHTGTSPRFLHPTALNTECGHRSHPCPVVHTANRHPGWVSTVNEVRVCVCQRVLTSQPEHLHTNASALARSTHRFHPVLAECQIITM